MVVLVFHVLLTRARTIARHFGISLTDRQHGRPYTCRWGHRDVGASARIDPHGATRRPLAVVLEEAAVKILCVRARSLRIESELPEGRCGHHARRPAAGLDQGMALLARQPVPNRPRWLGIAGLLP